VVEAQAALPGWINQITDIGHALTAVSVGLLTIGALLGVVYVVVLAFRDRRHRLVLPPLSNATGLPELDSVTAGLATLAREELVSHISAVGLRVRSNQVRLGNQTVGGSERLTLPGTDRHELPLPESDLVEPVKELVNSVRAVAPANSQPAVQLLGDLLLRPHGTRVFGVIYRRASHSNGDQFGISLELSDLLGEIPSSTFTLWEPSLETTVLQAPPPGGNQSPADQPGTSTVAADATFRLIGLLGPVCRILALELSAQQLLGQLGRFRRPGRWGAKAADEGVTRNFFGLLYQASAGRFTTHATVFYGRAIDQLTKAAELLPSSFEVLVNLADTYGLRARVVPSPEASSNFYRAVRTYDEALVVLC
jgi:hypothetical protein